MTTFHDRLRERLSVLGKSYRAASLDSGMSPEAISTLLRNTAMSPTLATVEKLAQGLQTTPAWLAFGAPEPDHLHAAHDERATGRTVGVATISDAREKRALSKARQHDTRSIQASVGALHQLVSGALQNESIPEEQADAYADVVLELLEERTTESVVLRLKEEHRNDPVSPARVSADRS